MAGLEVGDADRAAMSFARAMRDGWVSGSRVVIQAVGRADSMVDFKCSVKESVLFSAIPREVSE